MKFPAFPLRYFGLPAALRVRRFGPSFRHLAEVKAEGDSKRFVGWPGAHWLAQAFFSFSHERQSNPIRVDEG